MIVGSFRFPWQRRWLAMLCAVLAAALTCTPAAAQQTAAIERAIAYIRTQQQPDGSFAGLGPGSTADAVYALAAAGVNVAEVRRGDKNAIDYIRAQSAAAAQDVGLAAKFTIALLLAGQSPRQPEADVVAPILNGYDAASGRFGKDVTAHAYALIALVAAGERVPPAAIDALKALQLPDGGWSFDGTAATGSDTNTTSIAVQALIATGDRGEAVRRAVEYYRSQQNDDGGFPYSQSSPYGNASDANSTALAIQALIAAGEDPNAWAKNGATPIQRLLAFQNSSGAFRYQDSLPEDNAFATYQAVPALAGETLPLESIAIALPAPQPQPTPSVAPQPTPAPQPPVVVPPTLPDTGLLDPTPVLALLATALLSLGLLTRRRG